LRDTFLDVLERELRSVGLPPQLLQRISSSVDRSLNELLDAQQKELHERLEAMLKQDQESEARFWMHANAARKELFDQAVEQAALQVQESEARFWSHATEAHKAVYQQACQEASAALQRAAVDGTLVEVISEVKRSQGSEPCAAPSAERSETEWYLLPSVASWYLLKPFEEGRHVADIDNDTPAYCYDNDHSDVMLCNEVADDMMNQVVSCSLSWFEAVLDAPSEVQTLELGGEYPESVERSSGDMHQATYKKEKDAVKQVTSDLLQAAQSGSLSLQGDSKAVDDAMKQVAAGLLQAAKDGTLLRWQVEHRQEALKEVPGIGDANSPGERSITPARSSICVSEVASVAVHDALEIAAKHLSQLDEMRDDLLSVALSHGSDESWLLGDMAGEVTQQVVNSVRS